MKNKQRARRRRRKLIRIAKGEHLKRSRQIAMNKLEGKVEILLASGVDTIPAISEATGVGDGFVQEYLMKSEIVVYKFTPMGLVWKLR